MTDDEQTYSEEELSSSAEGAKPRRISPVVDEFFYAFFCFSEKISGFKARLAELNTQGAALDREIAKKLDSLHFNHECGKDGV